MKTVLIIGAGKSATVLIDYLMETAKEKNRKVIIADASLEMAQKKTRGHTTARAAHLDIHDRELRQKLIQEADIIVSMLPAFLHPIVAKDCLTFGKHFFSASYESAALKEMRKEIEEKNLLFLNECGLDPGLDHMSAMQIIDREKAQGNSITLFKSYTGGLLAPESENNPWKYKFTWNPRNVILAGQGVSRFIRNGKLKFIPYHMLFRRTETIIFDKLGAYDGYPNRDSLSYRHIYGLDGIPTILRGTLRRSGFCKSWDVFVQLGITDDSFEMDVPEGFTMRMFINSFLPYHETKTVEAKLLELLPWVDEDILLKVRWTGILEHSPLTLTKGSPAQILQSILEMKWQLQSGDKDMIVMQHQFEMDTPKGRKSITSSLIHIGKDQQHTAMAKTVGLPLAIAADLFMDGKIDSRGLRLPIHRDIYAPVLDRLKEEGIIFTEIETKLD
ncbi:saccharopine dehydrogenase family protein [Anditalea andensis]|uniref:Saccharopine dehydrogenase n=1 Tax=Anditalea andensis TaxID=1048983 RepID=A0A074KUR6_9BACT|nr:saccharopine dehydrogenase C-terminal domain-containing protein [Anditalea andensis]KEO73711.1 saccharopine dehydrogenase [Anditalea andensis]